MMATLEWCNTSSGLSSKSCEVNGRPPFTAIGKVDQLGRAIKSEYDDQQISISVEHSQKRNAFLGGVSSPYSGRKRLSLGYYFFALKKLCAGMHDCNGRGEHRLRWISALCEVYVVSTKKICVVQCRKHECPRMQQGLSLSLPLALEANAL